MAIKEKMVPFGILNLDNDQFHVFYGKSCKTSDFICDALESWWAQVREDHQNKEELVVYADNGPESNSHRTQFLVRLAEFSKKTGLTIRLVYYPPYHSKYNPIERTWAFLEKHWNGTLLNTAHTVVEWTKSMAWKYTKPVVSLVEKVYEKGVKPTKAELLKATPCIVRKPSLQKWDVTITPFPVHS